jgi:cell division protein FtsB
VKSADMKIRGNKLDLAVTIGCIALLGFFAWHGFQGPRSYHYLAVQQEKLLKLDAELASESAKKQGLEAKVALMRPESVDPDMLEELARSQLEMSRRNELIVLTNQ